MKRIFSRVLFCAIIIALFFFMIPVNTFADDKNSDGRVLFLSSYSYSWPTVPLQMEGIKDALGEDVNLDVEFMDTKQLHDEESVSSLSQKLKHKKEAIGQYDAVIAGDDAALHFIDENYESLFAGVPVVFEAVNDISYAKKMASKSNFTGVVEKISYSENIDFALKVQPEAERIVAIVDNTVTGKGEQEQFLSNRDDYPQLSFEMLNTSEMSYDKLKEKISALDDKTILIYLIFSEDRDGNTYSNSQVCRMLKETSPVPVYRFVQAGIGDGVLGGNIVSHKKSGEIAGSMVKEILDGKAVSEIPLVLKSPNEYYIDENIIREYNVSTSVIPKNATIINHQHSLWEKHGKVLMIFVLIAVFVLLFVMMLMRSLMDRRQKAELAVKSRELTAALKRAERADSSKSRFLAQTSHEIRTPLNIIIGLTGLAADEADNPDAIRDYLMKIEGSSKILLELINNILDMSSINDGKMKVEQSEFDFREQLTSLSVMFYQQSKIKNIRFDVHLKGVTEETLIGDSLRLNQILMNILGNAMKFTPSGGNVTMSVVQASASRERVHMRFIIKDTGIGMSRDMMDRLFDPFEQEDASTARKHGGSGLGMAITKKLTDLMGGTIRVESEPGVGTEFTVDIPFTRIEHDERRKLADAFSSYRALVVADCEESCNERGFCLEDMGLSYDVATDEEAALDMIGEAEDEGKPYRICVIDWRLSSEGGTGLIREIREIFGNDMIIIGASFDVGEGKRAGKEAGADYMVCKPVFRSTLFDAMMKVSEGKIDEYDNGSEYEEYNFEGKRVLVAEDVALNMEVAVKILSKTGLSVTCVENGKEAVDVFIEKPANFFDCIFLDINMPVMDGYEAAREIRACEKADAKTVPVYAMTANAFTSDVSAALDAGMDGHIAKPIERDVLYKMLANLFEENGRSE